MSGHPNWQAAVSRAQARSSGTPVTEERFDPEHGYHGQFGTTGGAGKAKADKDAAADQLAAEAERQRRAFLIAASTPTESQYHAALGQHAMGFGPSGGLIHQVDRDNDADPDAAQDRAQEYAYRDPTGAAVGNRAVISEPIEDTIARMQAQLENHNDQLTDHTQRLNALEQP